MLKKINTLHSCHNFTTGSRQAARVTRICETSRSDSTRLVKHEAGFPMSVLIGSNQHTMAR